MSFCLKERKTERENDREEDKEKELSEKVRIAIFNQDRTHFQLSAASYDCFIFFANDSVLAQLLTLVLVSAHDCTIARQRRK